MNNNMLAAGIIALAALAGTASSQADEWRRGHAQRGYSHHQGHYQPSRSQYYAQPRHQTQPRYYAQSPYAHPGYGAAPTQEPAYEDVYARRAAYNAAFNRGAEAQYAVDYQAWLYRYAAWRRTYGPTGIFAAASGLTSGVTGQYGQAPCPCE